MGEVIGVYGGEAAADLPQELNTGRSKPSTARWPEPRLFLVFRNHDYLILSYDDLESVGNPPGVEANSVVLLRFRGSVPREVRIRGPAAARCRPLPVAAASRLAKRRPKAGTVPPTARKPSSPVSPSPKSNGDPPIHA